MASGYYFFSILILCSNFLVEMYPLQPITW